MRTIKFRGQRVDNKEWVYGFLFVTIPETERYFIITNETPYNDECLVSKTIKLLIDSYHEVIPETVGQSTGYDELFEGDIVEAYRRSDAERKEPMRSEVTFLNGCFMLFNCTTHEFYRIWQSNYEIIGNIHQK